MLPETELKQETVHVHSSQGRSDIAALRDRILWAGTNFNFHQPSTPKSFLYASFPEETDRAASD